MSWLLLLAPAAVIIAEADVVRDEPPPHGAIGMSTAYRMSDKVPNRNMEFRRRVLHPGAAIGAHPIGHDEVYYVLGGEGEVISAGKTTPIGPGMATPELTPTRKELLPAFSSPPGLLNEARARRPMGWRSSFE